MSGKRLTPQQMKAALDAEMQEAANNRAATGTGNPLPTSAPGQFTDGTALITLSVLDVRPYEENPRTESNAKFLEIKESIRIRGLDQQLTVTKRPGADHYILAKGGKTRLLALQALAKEESRFEKMDFRYVAYKSETELLIAHMSENLQREGMSFWDIANGFLNLRTKRSRELGRDIPLRAFAAELRGMGFDEKIDLQTLTDFDFLVNVLSGTSSVRQIGRRDVRNLLRPQRQAFAALSKKLFDVAKADAFDETYSSWLLSFVPPVQPDSTEIAPTLASEEAGAEDGQEPAVGQTISWEASSSEATTLSPVGQALHAHLRECCAQWMGYEAWQLDSLTGAISRNSKIGINELQAILRSGMPQEPSFLSTDDADDADSVSTGGTAGSEHSNSSDFEGSGQESGHNSQQEFAQEVQRHRTPSHLDGVITAPEHLLTRLPATKGSGNAAADPSSASSAGSTDESPDGQDTQGMQGTLEGTSGLDGARDALRASIVDMADFAGISATLRDAPLMPLCFYIEIPDALLGISPSDISVQAWWFLVNTSCQLTAHWFNHHEVHGEHAHYAIADTGPNGFRQLASDETVWMQVVETHLGGTYLADGQHVLDLLTDLLNPLSEYALQVVRCAGHYRLMAHEAAQALGAAGRGQS